MSFTDCENREIPLNKLIIQRRTRLPCDFFTVACVAVPDDAVINLLSDVIIIVATGCLILC